MPDSGKTAPVANQAAASNHGRIIVALVFVAALSAFFYFDLGRYLSLDAIKNNRDRLLSFAQAHYGRAVGLYVLAYVVQTAFSLPGGALMTLVGGFLFGPVLATVYVNLGATIGATLAFLAARYLLRDWVERKFGDRLASLQAGFERNAFSYLLTLRLIPLFPFFLVNLVSGLTRVGVGTYILATSIGIIPGTFVYAFAGRQLGTINSVREVVSPNVLLAFTLLGLLALLPMIYKKVSAARHKPQSSVG